MLFCSCSQLHQAGQFHLGKKLQYGPQLLCALLSLGGGYIRAHGPVSYIRQGQGEELSAYAPAQLFEQQCEQPHPFRAVGAMDLPLQFRQKRPRVQGEKFHLIRLDGGVPLPAQRTIHFA